MTECEERYGVDEVERLLDSCHALMNYGVDRYKRPQKNLAARRESPAEKVAKSICKVRSICSGVPCRSARKRKRLLKRAAIRPNHKKNLLYFMEKKCATAGIMAA
ncbi:SpoVR family protein [Escherichia coli]